MSQPNDTRNTPKQAPRSFHLEISFRCETRLGKSFCGGCLLISRKNGVHALNESVELRHVLAEEVLGLLVADVSILGDQSALELNVRLD